MPDIEGAQRKIREAHDLLDQLGKIASLAAKDYSVHVADAGVSLRLPPNKIEELAARYQALKLQAASVINNLPGVA